MYNGSAARIIAGRGGLDGNFNSYQKQITSLERAKNIRFDGFTWKRAPAITSFDSNAVSGEPLCLAGHDWRPSGSIKRQITVWDNGKIYKEVSGDVDSVELEASHTYTGQVTLVEARDSGGIAGRNLYFYGKGFAPKQLVGDGSSLSAITNESADWASNKPGSAIYHDARVIAFDVDSAPHNIYVSDIDDHGDFTGGISKVFEVRPGTGDRIVAAFSYLPQQLYIFKYPYGIISVDTTDITGSYLPNTPIRNDVGMAGPHAVTKIGSDVVFVSSNGRLYSLQALRPDIDPIDADITSRLNLGPFIDEFVDLGKLASATLVFDENRKELTYAFTSKNSDTNDMALVFDLNEPGNIKAAIDDRGEVLNCLWRRIDENGASVVMSGGNDGKIYELNAVGNSIDGVAFETELQTISTDLGYTDSRLEGRIKRFDQLEINYIPEGSADLDIEVIVDGRVVFSSTISLVGDGATFDGAAFGEAVFAGQESLIRRFDLDACGNEISIRVTANGVDEDFIITQFKIYYRPLGKLGEI